MNLTNFFRTYGSYVEQPRIIRTVGHYAAGICGAGGIAGLTAMDTYKAQPDERNKVLIRDALVLGGTAVGTFLAARHFMPLPTAEEAKIATEHFVKDVKGVLENPEYSGAYNNLIKHLDTLKDKAKLQVADYKKIISEIEEKSTPEKAKEVLSEIFEGEDDFPGFTKELWPKLTQKGIISKDKMVEEGEVRKMFNFFVVGGLSVLSGIAGGLAANKINKVKDPNSTVNMVKEGVFQFVANIALCAVGAFGAILGMSHKPIAQGLANMGPMGKALKTLGICMGLSLGIFGGGVIANKLGANVINPLCDKIQGKELQPQTDPKQGKRKIEFWDAILHLDDVPTALALAGLEIVEPIIPYFFGISGYRAGIGYRNDPSSKAAAGGKNSAPIPSQDVATAAPGFAQADPSKLEVPAMEQKPEFQQAQPQLDALPAQLKAQNNPFGIMPQQAQWQTPQWPQLPQPDATMPSAAPAA